MADSAIPPPRPQVFYGRQNEVNQLTKLCLAGTSSARLAITGAGGIGKTSLALAFLHSPRIKRHYRKHRLFVSCEGSHDADDVIASLALKLGLHGAESPLRAVIQTLESRASPTLLVLDNLESVWSPTQGENYTKMEEVLAELATAQNLTFLITLRWTVLPASVLWSNANTAALGNLSLEHARSMFIALTQQNVGVLALELAALHELLHEVDYMPLAIKLLARLNDAPARLLREWTEVRSGVLQADWHDGSRRELSVEVSIDLSLTRLGHDDRARQLLVICARLPVGLFPDIFNLMRAGFEGIDQAKEQLEQHALVHIGPSMEISMLSPIRHYALAHLTLKPQHVTDLQRIYVALADRFPDDIYLDYSPGDEVGYEAPNAAAVLQSMLETDGISEEVALMATRIAAYMHRTSRSTALIVALLARLKEPSLVRAQCLRLLALAHSVRYEFDEAIELLALAQSLYEQFLSQLGVGICHSLRAHILFSGRKDVDAAEPEYKAAARAFASVGWLEGEAWVQLSRGKCALARGRFALAEELIRAASDTYKQMGDSYNVAKCLRDLASVFFKTRRWVAGQEANLSACAEFAKLGAKACQALCEYTSAIYNMDRGDLNDAQKHVECARDLFKETSDTRGLACVMIVMAGIASLQGQQARADRLSITGIKMFEQSKDHVYAQWARRVMDEQRARRSRLEQAPMRRRVVIGLFAHSTIGSKGF